VREPIHFYVEAMATRLLAAAFDAQDPARLAEFWAGLLGRDIVDDAGGALLLPGDDTQVGLRFVPSSSVKLGPGRLHLHLTSATPEEQQQTVATALRLGASNLDVGQLPRGAIVLADPSGKSSA
jgi:hypothetical protein